MGGGKDFVQYLVVGHGFAIMGGGRFGRHSIERGHHLPKFAATWQGHSLAQ